MPKTSRVSRNNTRIERHPDGSLKRVTLHNTVVFEQSPVQEDGKRVIAISNGGWNTVTTQTRINQCFRESGIPANYSRAKGVASLRYLTCKGAILSAIGAEWVDHPMQHGHAMLETLQIATDGWLKIVRPCLDSFVVIN